MKGIIYYTDNQIEEPVRTVVQNLLLSTGLPIVSCSLEPIRFGQNVVVKGMRGYPTMVDQITTALETSVADNVFFCEHDVLYPLSHFEFTPPKRNIFYYNENVWRWWFGSDHAMTHDRMLPLSSLSVNREFALDHYKKRQAKIKELDPTEWQSREPIRARLWGYEPGTKKRRRGGFSDDDFETWRSTEPIIDIRHRGTFSPPKINLDSYKHKPTGWREIPIAEIPGWNLKKIFNL